MTPVWPTMSGFAKLMIRTPGLLVELHERVGGLARAHLRLVVVGRDVARRRHELADLALVRVLLAAVEEVRHVRVLLGLRDVQLRRPLSAITWPMVSAGRSGGKTTGWAQSSSYSASVT